MTDIMKQNLIKKYGQDYVNAITFSMTAEGLFANVVGDKGGITFKGIARIYNARWDGWRIIDKALEQYPELKTPYNKAPESVKKLNEILNGSDELSYLVFDFYFENYFKKVGADRIGGKLAAVIDIAATPATAVTGTLIWSGLIPNVVGAYTFDLSTLNDNMNVIGTAASGTQAITGAGNLTVVAGCIKTATVGASVVASLNWKELV